MRLIINASLKQVNLVWSTVSVLKADAPVSYPGNQPSPSFPLFSQAHTALGSWCGFHFLYGSQNCRGISHLYQPLSHAIHLHHTFMDQRSQALLPPLPNPLPYSKFLVISAPNLKPRLFLNHLLSNETIFSHFREARNTWIYSLHSIPLGIWHFAFSMPRNNEQVWCQNLKLSTRHSCETQRDNCEMKSWAESGAEEPSLTPQGFIRLLQPNLVPLMNKPRWFSPVCPTSALLRHGQWPCSVGHRPFQFLELQPWAWLPSVTTLTCATLESPASRAAREWDCWGYRAHKPGVTLHKWVDCAVQLFYFNKIKNMHSTCSASI